jgi:nicotinamide-nucleotide amidase
METMRAEIIAVGSELLSQARLETNSVFIAKRLNESGLKVMRKFVVEDREEEIRGALESAMGSSEVVILTGGLGPTHDDITREVVSKMLGRELAPEPKILEGLKSRYQRVGLEMTDNNLRQAMVPEGAQWMENPNGTAPGLFLREGDRLLFLLPGPPREMEPMMVQVMDLIGQYKQLDPPICRRLKVASETESGVDSAIGSIYTSYISIETTILSSPGMIELTFYWMGEANQQLAEDQLQELVARVRQKLGDSIFTDREEDLEQVVGRMLFQKGKTVATAESCTGGLLGKMLTDVPGSSDYYRGGVVCYSNDLKANLVGVNETTLERFGAVSEQVAAQMAVGIRESSGADLGLSVTGIAGPGGETAEKPIGLVFVGLSSDQVRVKKLNFGGPREAIRIRASRFALDWLRRSFL